MVGNLNEGQMAAFRVITETVLDERPGFFFVSGYGGTGKTFLWGTIVAWLCARGKIVLTVASSSVASLLLPGGRTTHSRLLAQKCVARVQHTWRPRGDPWSR